MFETVFQYVSGGATLLSLLLSMVPYLPSYKIYFKTGFVFFLGMFLGAFFTVASANTIVFNFEGSLFQTFVLILILVTGAIVMLVILAYALAPERKEGFEETKGVAGVSSFGFFVVLVLIYGLSSCEPTRNSTRIIERPIDDLAIARAYEEGGLVPKALTYYRRALEEEQRLRGKETEFYRTLNDKIDELLKQTGPEPE